MDRLRVGASKVQEVLESTGVAGCDGIVDPLGSSRSDFPRGTHVLEPSADRVGSRESNRQGRGRPSCRAHRQPALVAPRDARPGDVREDADGSALATSCRDAFSVGHARLISSVVGRKAGRCWRCRRGDATPTRAWWTPRSGRVGGERLSCAAAAHGPRRKRGRVSGRRHAAPPAPREVRGEGMGVGSGGRVAAPGAGACEPGPSPGVTRSGWGPKCVSTGRATPGPARREAPPSLVARRARRCQRRAAPR